MACLTCLVSGYTFAFQASHAISQMRIENLDAYPSKSHFETDIAIVGGGPAGLTIALEFMNSGATVLVLESGLEKDSLPHMELNRLEGRDSRNDEFSENLRRISPQEHANF